MTYSNFVFPFPGCRNKLFYNNMSTKRTGKDSVEVVLPLCNNCVRINSAATDLLSPYKAKEGKVPMKKNEEWDTNKVEKLTKEENMDE